MDHRKLQPYFLLILILVLAVFAVLLLRPFFGGLIFAVVLAVVFAPLHAKLRTRFPNYPGWSAFLSTVLILCFILLPVAVLSTQIAREAQALYYDLASSSTGTGFFSSLTQRLTSLTPWAHNFELDLNQYLRDSLSWLIQNLGSVFSSFAKVLLNLLVFFISLYYLLKDGDKLKRMVILLSPLSDTSDELVFKRLVLAVNSVVKGNLLIALIQGLLTAIGFALFGIPHFVLWGTVAAFAALIPGLGTALVLTPGVIYLFLTGHQFATLGLLVWSVLAVGLIDNLLGPRLIGHGIRLHPLLVLLAVIGGLVFFGPAGFVLGPLLVSLLSALLDIYLSLAGLTKGQGDTT